MLSGGHWPVTSGWQTLTGGRRSVTSGLPAPDTCSLTTTHQPLTTCRWPPAPRPPITGRWPRVTNQRSPTTDRWPLVTGHCPPIRARASPRVPPIPPESSGVNTLVGGDARSGGCPDIPRNPAASIGKATVRPLGNTPAITTVPTLSATDTPAMSPILWAPVAEGGWRKPAVVRERTRFTSRKRTSAARAVPTIKSG
jgi:hypothetical protein